MPEIYTALVFVITVRLTALVYLVGLIIWLVARSFFVA